MPKGSAPASGAALHIRWAADVAAHDYSAAEAHLSLKLPEEAVRRLRKVVLTARRAIQGEPLSPVLVLSGKKRADIADGFHRVSLVYRLDPYAEIPVKLG